MSPPDHVTSLEARFIEAAINQMRSEMTRQGDTLVGINESLRILARVEEAQANIKERLQEGSRKLSEHSDRLSQIENQLPGLEELRKWVVGGVLAGAGMIGLAILSLVLKG
jgi:chromosome segregation ATPase